MTPRLRFNLRITVGVKASLGLPLLGWSSQFSSSSHHFLIKFFENPKSFLTWLLVISGFCCRKKYIDFRLATFSRDVFPKFFTSKTQNVDNHSNYFRLKFLFQNSFSQKSKQYLPKNIFQIHKILKNIFHINMCKTFSEYPCLRPTLFITRLQHQTCSFYISENDFKINVQISFQYLKTYMFEFETGVARSRANVWKNK